MIVLGLTGGIAMGKSTTARMFRDLGVPVHDSDAAVHELYAGRAVPLVENRFPGTTSNGKVDRARLAAKVLGDRAAMDDLEALIHPLVRESETAFVAAARQSGEKLVVLDIPLLFETGADSRVDGVVVVSAPRDVQLGRAMQRPGMNREKFEAILRRQIPDPQKRRHADFVVDTSQGMEAARQSVAEIRRQVLSGRWHPPEKRGRR